MGHSNQRQQNVVSDLMCLPVHLFCVFFQSSPLIQCSGGYAEEGDCPPPCDGLDSAILGDQTLAYVNPYLFPCAIEFALIGACFFIAMSKNIGKM